MLELDNVSKTVDDQALLKRVSARVEAGELIGVLGPTGSGKTSLLRVIMGLDNIDGGEVRYQGTTLAKRGRQLVAPHSRGFSMVFESPQLLPFATVTTNILVGRRLGDAGAKERLSFVMDLVGLREVRDRVAHTLSGGEQQRVALARALFVEPKLLLLDEPFAALDRTWRETFVPRLRAYLEERGTAAILVTHDREEALAFGHRIFLVRAGELVRTGSAAEIYGRPRDEWEARLLGECNALSGDVARKTFAAHLQSEAVMIRPENIVLTSDDTELGNATLVDASFRGPHWTVMARTDDGVELLVRVVGEMPLQSGARVRLGLRRPDYAVELERREERERLEEFERLGEGEK